VNHSFRLLRSTLEAALPRGDLVLHHVRAHAGELFKEIVDTAAKLEAQKTFNMKRQPLHLPKWTPKLLQLWMAFGKQYGLPIWQDGGLDVTAPDLPDKEMQPLTTSWWKEKSETLHFAVSMAPANVQSLYRGPMGHAGKLHISKNRCDSSSSTSWPSKRPGQKQACHKTMGSYDFAVAIVKVMVMEALRSGLISTCPLP